MNITIDVDKVNLAENRDLLAQCLKDAPYLSMFDIEFEDGRTDRFLKMDKGEFLLSGEALLRYSTKDLYRLVDNSRPDYIKVVSVYLSNPVQSDLAKKHEKLLYNLTQHYEGHIVGGRFVSPNNPGYTQDVYFLDAHNDFAPVSRLQVVLTLLGDRVYDDFKKENKK